jgi:hypothetical protein
MAGNGLEMVGADPAAANQRKPNAAADNWIWRTTDFETLQF